MLFKLLDTASGPTPTEEKNSGWSPVLRCIMRRRLKAVDHEVVT
jgi:hypothetical protein